MTVTESSEKLWRRVMLAWSFFMGFGAILGGGMGMLSPLGEWYGGQAMVPNLQKLPFADIFFRTCLCLRWDFSCWWVFSTLRLAY